MKARRIKTLALALAVLAFGLGQANAGTSAPKTVLCVSMQSPGDIALAADNAGSFAKFQCESPGAVGISSTPAQSLNDLALKGWHVVALTGTGIGGHIFVVLSR